MKHHCPMCGEQWDEDVCASCGWFEGKQPRYSEWPNLLRRAYVYRESEGDLPMEKKVPKELDAIVDKVLSYRPKARSKPAVQRKRRKTILEKQRAKEK